MWKSPRYDEVMGQTAEAEPQGPPAEQGERLAVFPRGDGVEMRVTLAEYQGRPYVSLRVWERGSGGAFWPTKKGCSVRLSEAGELARVLAEVAAPAETARPDAQSHVEPPRRLPSEARPTRRDWRENHVPLEPRGPAFPGGLPLNSESFSEFGEPEQ